MPELGAGSVGPPGTARRSGWRVVLAYLREVTGENAYDHYLDHRARAGHDGEPLSRSEFYRRRERERYGDLGSRCPC